MNNETKRREGVEMLYRLAIGGLAMVVTCAVWNYFFTPFPFYYLN